MRIGRSGAGFFENPHATVYLLLVVNFSAYGLCLAQSGASTIPSNLLLNAGAMYSGAISQHEYWRLVAYGFLHANLIHLVSNMFCLALWGAHLEKRVGAFYFIVIYFCALICGGVVSYLTHATPYLAVGASGAISGILGALLCLWILGKSELPFNFFVVNIGLNVVLLLSAPNIDWAAHLGGFTAGMATCAVLDLVEKLNAFLLRCKFPEFVKINSFIGLGGLALLLWQRGLVPPIAAAPPWLPPLAYGLACLVMIKLIDLVLAIKKGVAAVVVLFALVNGALGFFGGTALAAMCLRRPSFAASPAGLFDMMCANQYWTLPALACCAFVLTVVIYWPWLYRGITDVGFLGASLAGERKRRQGI